MDGNLSEISTSEKLLPTSLAIQEILTDYRLAYQSRQVSILGRREVLSGKAKFGIFGDGKELAQIAMAKVFLKGDIRSGYYRDQTFAFAKGLYTFEQFFAQLYAHIDVAHDPHSAGRMMNAHIATRMLDEAGQWKDLTQMYVSSADVSCTAAQMPRIVGLSQASILYRKNPELKDYPQFSRQGNEVVFGTIGNGSCAEGHFWEAINAIGVLSSPAVISIWDDEYGISVPNEFQLTKGNLSEIIQGFQRKGDGAGFEIFRVKGWDFEALVQTYEKAATLARESHVPSIIHVVELTQPQGHSTSGSHERYKPAARLKWERENDCLLKMRNWILASGWVAEETLEDWEKEDRLRIREARKNAWNAYQVPIKQDLKAFIAQLNALAELSAHKAEITALVKELTFNVEPFRKDMLEAFHQVVRWVHPEHLGEALMGLKQWKDNVEAACEHAYSSYLTDDSAESPQRIAAVPPVYSDDAPLINGFELLNKCFDSMFARDPRLVAFGEDLGALGDVNQGFAGLQKKYGDLRIMDTGIRETTIMGQAIGLAMRGLRPIAEIQYLDYFIYGIQTLADDLASLTYRTFRGQKAPVIIRTRGHRLEGIWHAGSPMGMIIHALRGVHVCVPRNMTQAAGMYHTLLQGDEPAIVVEVLNGYRLKEKLPENLETFRVPLGIPEVLREGTDITVVTYGACCRLALEAAEQLVPFGVSVEVVDIQTLLPFDREARIVSSLKKTNRILFLDEDVPGGASAYMMQQVLEKHGGYRYLDSAPITLTAKAHRCAYGTDGDFFSKPQTMDIFQALYGMMEEVDPVRFPAMY